MGAAETKAAAAAAMARKTVVNCMTLECGRDRFLVKILK